jgi:hypothetical protein
MVRQRPTSILIIAILHLIGGGIGILGSCYSVVVLAASGTSAASAPAIQPAPSAPPGRPATPAPPSASQIMKYYEEHVPGYKVFTYAGMAVSLILDLMLLASGIGLLLMHPWARLLSLIYAPLSILFHLLSFAYQLAFVMPAMHDLFAQSSAFGPMGSVMAVATDIGFVLSLLVIIYPIVVVILLLRRSTVAAFRGEVPRQPDEGSPDEPDRWDTRDDAFTS